MTIGLIVTEIINPYFAELAMAVDQITHDAGYTIFIGYSRDHADRQHEIIASMIERQVDGHPPAARPGHRPGKARQAGQRRQRSGGAARPPVSPASITSAARTSRVRRCSETTSRRLGCRSVAFLGGRPAPSLAEREEGLRTSLEPSGCEVWSTDEFRSAITPEGGAAAVGRLFDQGRLPDAVIAYNDIVAEGVYDEMRRRGLEPGRDIAVASFDDTRIAASQVPPMTSVAGFPQQIGAKGTEMLMTRLSDGNADIPHATDASSSPNSRSGPPRPPGGPGAITPWR